MKLEILGNLINQEFGLPFLPEGTVRAKLQEDGTLKLWIGRRDVHFDDKGTVLGAGTCLESPKAEE